MELKTSLDTYREKKRNVTRAIESIMAQVKEKELAIELKAQEINDLEKQMTSIQPTINGINRLLKSFGFGGFKLEQAENRLCYKLVRPDGGDARETLSEGERTLLTFLYFCYLLKGSAEESGVVTNRIVVFDDPVSSLDSDVLFVVSSFVRGLIDEVRSGAGVIKQVFVLTHNVYFFKEITFNSRRRGEVLSEETFWTIRKLDSKSVLEKHDSNPVKTSYEMLWAEVRSHSHTNFTIQNTLRRILENYFRILGGIELDDLCNEFEGSDRNVCRSLLSWVHDGSHWAHDDLYVSHGDSVVEGYLRVFREIFKRTGQLAHYKMMMGDAWVEEESEDVMELTTTQV